MSDSIRIRDMPWEEMRQVFRLVGPEIGRLAKRGDQFAKKVFDRYSYAFDHPDDKQANLELRIAFEDYMTRDLTLLERFELMSRYGHQLDEKEVPRIFVPGGIGKQ